MLLRCASIFGEGGSCMDSFIESKQKWVWGAAVLGLMLGSQALAQSWNNWNNPENFNASWHPVQYDYRFSSLPASGKVPLQNTPWGDSYWPKNRGAFTYRWLDFQQSGHDQTLTSSDRKRLFFSYHYYTKKELKSMSQDQIKLLSPLEKYSILMGDYHYRIVKHYERVNSPDSEYWEGYCHAWSAASSHYAEPLPVVRTNKDGITIPFGSADVKALLTANYADLNWGGGSGANAITIRFVGQMCHRSFQPPTSKIKNGREVMADYGDTDGLLDVDFEKYVADYQQRLFRVKGTPIDPTLAERLRAEANAPECSDTNPGAFHVVMANQLGLMHEGFLMDKTRDNEVWNQPVSRFESNVVGVEAPTSESAPGTAQVVRVASTLYYGDDTDYGWAFWNPTLSGMFGLKNYFTSFLDEYQAYQNVLMKEGDEKELSQYPDHVEGKSHYQYRLDLDSQGKIIGGNWITFDRPDDLYMVKKVGFMGHFNHLGDIYEPATPTAQAFSAIR